MKTDCMFVTSSSCIILRIGNYSNKFKGKAVPLQAWSGPEGSSKLRFPYFITTAQKSGKVINLTNRPPLPQEILLVLISVRG